MDDTIKISVFIDFKGCAGCEHLMMEEVEYDLFVREDCSGIAVPEGKKPPVIICAKDYPKILSAPLGPRCSDYVEAK